METKPEDLYEYGALAGWGCVAGPHAVIHTSGAIPTGYCYDANGNMTLRWPPGGSFIYSQGWDADNKLIQVDKLSSDGAYTYLGTLDRFYYDADGNRVRKVETGAVQFSDDFNTLDTLGWAYASLYPTVVADAGQNVLKTTSDNNWRALNRSTYTLASGKQMSIDFKLDNANTGAHYILEDGINSLFGVVASGGNIYVHYADAGCGWCAGPTLVTGTVTNLWYRLTITVDDGAGFKVEIKQRDTGAGYASYTRAMNLSSGRNWRFQHFMYTAGTAAYMDNYVEQVTGSQTTAYVGNHYKCVPGQACTSYYYFNGRWTAYWVAYGNSSVTKCLTRYRLRWGCRCSGPAWPARWPALSRSAWGCKYR